MTGHAHIHNSKVSMHIIDLTVELPLRAMPKRTVKRKAAESTACPEESWVKCADEGVKLRALLERVDVEVEKAGVQVPPVERRALKLVKRVSRPVRRTPGGRGPPLHGPGLDICGYKADSNIYIEVDTAWE